MDPLRLNTTASVRQFFEKLLLICTMGLILFHMLISVYKNAIPTRGFVRHVDEWLGLVLLIAVLLFLVFLLVTERKQAPFRIIGFFSRFKAYEYWFQFFTAVWYVVSCAVRQAMTGKNSFQENDWWLYVTWLMSFAVFPFARIVGAKKAKKYIDPVLAIVLIPHILFFAWLLWNYFHKNYVILPSGNALEMTPGPGLAAGENRNNTAFTALTMMGLCWYMVFSQKAWRKLPFLFGVAVYLAIVTLTNSRTSWYASVVMLMMLTFSFVWRTLRGRSQTVRVMAGFVAAVLCILLMNAMRGGWFELLDRAVNFTGNYPPVTAQAASRTLAPEDGLRLVPLASPKLLSEASDYARSGSGLSGRKEIYEACIEMMFSRKAIFMFGVTHKDVPATIFGVRGVRYLYSDAHNYWLQMGLAFGVPMLLLAIVFTVLLVRRCLRVLFREKEPFSGAWTLPLLVLSIFVLELMETQISAGSSIVCPAFYLFAGWVTSIDLGTKSGKASKKEEKPA